MKMSLQDDDRIILQVLLINFSDSLSLCPKILGQSINNYNFIQRYMIFNKIDCNYLLALDC